MPKCAAEVNLTYYKTLNGRARCLLANARYRAKRKGLAVTIDAAWIKRRLQQGRCPRTGFEFDFEASGNGRSKPFAPSLHRKNPNRGYTKRNTVVVAWIFNRMLGEFSYETVLSVAKALLERQEA